MDLDEQELEGSVGDSSSTSTSYTELNVWKEARYLVKDIYNLTATFPESEKMGLTQQMRTLAVCVPSKIAEGAGRKQAKHSLKYLLAAKGALFELETMAFIAMDLGFCMEYQATEIIEKIITSRKLLFGYIRFKERKSNERGNV